MHCINTALIRINACIENIENIHRSINNIHNKITRRNIYIYTYIFLKKITISSKRIARKLTYCKNKIKEYLQQKKKKREKDFETFVRMGVLWDLRDEINGKRMTKRVEVRLKRAKNIFHLGLMLPRLVYRFLARSRETLFFVSLYYLNNNIYYFSETLL